MLVGRDDVLEDIGDGLSEGPGALERPLQHTELRDLVVSSAHALGYEIG